MHPLIVAADALFLGLALTVSIRLLLLARRTRGLPELLAALALLCLAPIGGSLGFVTVWLAPTRPDLTAHTLAAAIAADLFGTTFAALFTAVVFRARSAAAVAAVTGAAAAMTVCWLGALFTRDFEPARAAGLFRNLLHVFQVAVLAWGSVESFVYWRLMKRRLAFGLAEPVVVNRFGLWTLMLAIAASSITLISLANAPGLQYVGRLIFLPISLGGLVALACMVLAFLPPRRYLEWVERRARAAREPGPAHAGATSGG